MSYDLGISHMSHHDSSHVTRKTFPMCQVLAVLGIRIVTRVCIGRLTHCSNIERCVPLSKTKLMNMDFGRTLSEIYEL